MSDALTVDRTGPPTAAKAHVQTPAGRKQIGRSLKVALDAIVWKGADWKAAAVEAGLTTHAVRKALARPHVQQYLRAERHVFRESARAQNIHRVVAIRDQDVNLGAAVQAARLIEGQTEGEARREAGRNVTPGVVVSVTVQGGARSVDETIISVGPGAIADGKAADDEV